MWEAQQKVQAFVNEHGLSAEVMPRLVDLVSEVGEVSKEILKVTDYGRRPLDRSIESDLETEMGDLLFALLCLANALNLDLETCLDQALAKYRARLSESGQIGS